MHACHKLAEHEPGCLWDQVVAHFCGLALDSFLAPWLVLFLSAQQQSGVKLCAMRDEVVNQAPSLRAIAVIGFGAPNLVRKRRNSSPSAERLPNNAFAAMRNAYATRFLFFAPLISCFGVRAAQLVKAPAGSGSRSGDTATAISCDPISIPAASVRTCNCAS